MKFSIIIINYNTFEYTKNCLASIFSYSNPPDYEIILVDNASKDRSQEKLETEFGGRIKIIKNQENRGFGAANNQGAKIAEGDYLFFLNSDTVLEDNILDKLENCFGRDDAIAVVAPRLLTSEKKFQADAFGDFPKFWTTIFKKLAKAKTFDAGQVDWASGAALAVKKEAFESIGGFDENFFMYFEDIDLCKRLKEKGRKAVVCGKAEVIHFGGKSEADYTKTKILYYQAQDYYFKKHFGFVSFGLIKIFRRIYLLFKK